MNNKNPILIHNHVEGKGLVCLFCYRLKGQKACNSCQRIYPPIAIEKGICPHCTRERRIAHGNK